MTSIQKVIFIGAGNVSSHIANALSKTTIDVLAIYSRTKGNASVLAKQSNSHWGDFSNIKLFDADLVIVSVPDKALIDVLKLIPKSNAMVVHTSGSIDINILKMFKRTGVFYPLQTFSKNKSLNFSLVPIMLESHTDDDLALLEKLAKHLTEKTYHITSAQRKKIHIAAVFANNFSNYLFHIASDLLAKDDIPFEVIQPLIAETAEKLNELNPYEAQTGPAVRSDEETIQNHLQDLDDFPDYQAVYKLLSQQISNSRKTKNYVKL